MPRLPLRRRGECRPAGVAAAVAIVGSLVAAPLILLLAAALLTAAAPAPAGAQYFGQNRVRYDRFDPRILRTQHFEVHHDAAAEPAVRSAARMAERWVARLSPAFGGHTFAARKPVILYTNHPDFAQTTLSPTPLGEGTRGFAEGLRDRLVMPLAASPAETDHVLGHEVAHLFQFDVAERAGGGIQRMLALPLWFVEGHAEYLALGRRDPNTALWLRGALARGRLPTVAQLSDPAVFPYRYGHAFWAYVAGRWGDGAVNDLFRAALAGGVEGGIALALRTTGAQLSDDWHAAVQAEYGPALADRELPGDAGRPVFGVTGSGEGMALAPALSPDGTRAAFYTRTSPFAVDLVVGDPATGRVLRPLGGAALDAHADALSFLYAVGAWHPEGTRFAHVVVRKGDHEIAISDPATGRLVQRVRLRGVQAVSAVAWSPDGQRLAVAGTRDGQPDLFVYDFAQRTTRQVTDDAHAELHPAWSPDGRFVAVATDRGPGADPEALAFGRLRLALVDPVGGRVRVLPVPDAMAGARLSNPQWSPDGRWLYFVGDAGGVADVFRMRVPRTAAAASRAAARALTPEEAAEAERSDGAVAVDRLTRLVTGVSGLTERSPALTVAARTGAVLFTAFDGDAHRVYALDPARLTGGSEAVTAVEAGDATPGELALPPGASLGRLPPGAAVAASDVEAYLRDPEDGLPGPTAGAFASRGYRARLTLEGVGTPGIGLATNGVGGAVGGGVSAVWGDLLSARRLAVAVQAQGSFRDIGAQVQYLNQQSRWNWFLTAGRTPVAGAANTAEAVTVRDGAGNERAGTLFQQGVARTFFDQAGAGAQYPFSRTRRVELAVTGTRVSQALDARQTLVVGGRVVDQRAVRGGGAPAFHYGQTTLALVGDDARFGPVGPIGGGRWRLEVGRTFGGLAHGTVLADARRYLALGRTTLALRGFHYGRYGRDAEHRLLPPLFLGETQLVRGYAANTFADAECVPDAARPGACPAVERLLGSRLGVASVEWRLPLAGVRGWSLFRRGLPLELAPFVDAGVAWRAGDGPRLSARSLFDRPAGAARVPVFGAGLAARLNAGPFIVEGFWARPLQRDRPGVFGFNLAPSW